MSGSQKGVMKKRLLRGLGVFVLTSSLVDAQTLNIDHQPVGCAAAEKFPRLEARFAPADSVAIARVVFQGQSPEWYSVAMKPEGAVYSGVLPKPKKSLKAFRYYIEVTDKALGTNRTAEYTTNVVDSSSACKGKIMAGTLGSASVVLQGPAGAAALPVGFASNGVVAAGSGSATGAAGASTAGAGGGIGATALVVGGLAAAGGAAALALPKGGEEGSSGGSQNPGSPPVQYDVAFVPSPPGIDVSVCAGRPTTFGSVQVTPNSSGAFDTVGSIITPVLRVVGQVTATTFQATLTCTNGAQSGSVSTTGSTNSYSGTFEFGASRGQAVVTKK